MGPGQAVVRFRSEAVSLDRLYTYAWPLRECEMLVGSTCQTRPEAKPFWSR
jgi:hypothetical protein